MTSLITGLIGVAGMCIFLGILLWWIKAVPLIVIVLLVMALVVVDFVQSLSSGDGTSS